MTDDTAQGTRLRVGSADGVELDVLEQGATVQRLVVTGGDGVRRNVVLGHATEQEYLDSTDYLGAVVGRYANRIAEGHLVLDGVEHRLGVNDRGHHLHGGPDGFDRRRWEVVRHDADRVELTLVSPDGDQGYPGRLQARASYAVEGSSVLVDLRATTDAPTIVNLTSHCYFALDGDVAGTSVLDHLLRVPAEQWTPVDAAGIPTGEEEPVDGTPFDLRGGPRVRDVLAATHPQLADAGGVDHDVVPAGTGMRTVAEVVSPATRTRLEVRSDRPALQVYTGNFLDGSTRSLAGHPIERHAGLALEPQVPPDSPNRPALPGCVLRPGETWSARIEWHFSAVDA
ncbi:aldose 1-epimerase [Marmoricola endophyticus]|uniref:Aldose 1-epimerase n=1 Tax=Marmoricola endophyticus TaxID=2040280 RepID=A0A917BKB1_9ACTN|nr:aldose epimerase family protein [Marmoricola endophyticus]GGF46496.1 aldose 1-epimerase [Marmoricola endophyticus]